MCAFLPLVLGYCTVANCMVAGLYLSLSIYITLCAVSLAAERLPYILYLLQGSL